MTPQLEQLIDEALISYQDYKWIRHLKNSLLKDLAPYDDKVQTLVEVVRKDLKRGPPIAYAGEEDSIGHCAYCGGFNGTEHLDSCEWSLRMRALAVLEEEVV